MTLVGEKYLERVLDEEVIIADNNFRGILKRTRVPKVFYVERRSDCVYVIRNGDRLLIDEVGELIARPY